MQLGRVGVGIAELGDLLAARHLLVLLHEDLAVVGVDAVEVVVVLDDDQLAVAADPGPDVDHPPRGGSHHRGTRSNWTDLKGMGLLEVEAISYIRGRSIPRQFMVVDEAQNLTPHEVKTIVTRVGEGTKIVLTGDPYQIDNPYLDAESNGLTWLVERFKGQRLAGHVTLLRGERSELAELAANLL